MNCESFRNAIERGVDDAAVRDHLRSCDACMEWAVSVDPDMMFRALGVGESEPPGGTDLFVADVLRQVEMRDAERRLGRRTVRFGSVFRWSAAAALTVGILGTLVMQRGGVDPVAAPQARPAAVAAVQVPVVDRPVVEQYDSAGATIIEVPPEDANDIRLVMVFDESLPVDL